MREAYADVNSALTVPGGKENLQLALAKLTLSMDPGALEKFKKKSTTNQMASMLFFTNAIEEVPTWNARELVEIWKTTKVPWYAEIYYGSIHILQKEFNYLKKFLNTNHSNSIVAGGLEVTS